MMNECTHCGKEFKPRVNGQEYCSNKTCQRARRARWQRNKMSKDLDYKDNQRRCQKDWMQKHPDYWKQYRENHPEYVERNKILQVKRDAKRRNDRMGKFLAKMDVTAKGFYSRKGGLFKLIPQGNRLLAKMDVITVKLVAVGGGH